MPAHWEAGQRVRGFEVKWWDQQAGREEKERLAELLVSGRGPEQVVEERLSDLQAKQGWSAKLAVSQVSGLGWKSVSEQAKWVSAQEARLASRRAAGERLWDQQR